MKVYGVYIIPKVEVQISGSFRSIPGQIQVAPPQTDVNAGFVATNAFLATNSTLGRPLSGATPNVTLQLLEPYTKFLDRRNELDLRFGKVLRMRSGSRVVVSLDLYNAINSDATVNVNQAFASYLAPTEILNPRVAKVSVNFDFLDQDRGSGSGIGDRIGRAASGGRRGMRGGRLQAALIRVPVASHPGRRC